MTYFSLCLDANNEAYGWLGVYKELDGICQRVDDIYKVLYVDDAAIAFEDIFSIEDIETPVREQSKSSVSGILQV